MKSNISGERFISIADNVALREVLNTIADGLNVKKPHIYAPSWMTEIAWRIDWMANVFLRQKRKFFKDTSKAAHSDILYSNEKIISTLNYKFRDIKEYILNYCTCNRERIII